jgi:hypothetical protein
MSSGGFRRILPADLRTNPTASSSLDVEGATAESWNLNKGPKALTACKQCKKSKTKVGIPKILLAVAAFMAIGRAKATSCKPVR